MCEYAHVHICACIHVFVWMNCYKSLQLISDENSMKFRERDFFNGISTKIRKNQKG